MFRIILVVGILFLSLFRGSICLADDQSTVLEKLETLFFGTDEKPATLVVESDPHGAAVFVDNILKGKTPCTLDGIAPGTLTVEVELEGYASQDKELTVQPGDTQTLRFKLQRIRTDAVTALSLRADPAGSAVRGAAVTFQAKGSRATGKVEYRFSKMGPATGEKWVQVQAYSDKSTWTWKPGAEDVGTNRIAVAARSLGSKAAQPEASKAMVYKVNAVAPATGVSLSADPAGSTTREIAVTFQAKASGGTGNYEYRFLKKGPATGEKWVQAQAYSTKNTWTWKPGAEDVGTNRIAVAARSLGSKAVQPEASKSMVYKIGISLLETFVQDLEQKIADGEKRMVAHPSFLEELKALVQRYKKDMKSQK